MFSLKVDIILKDKTKMIIHLGDIVVPWLVLFPHSEKVTGSILNLYV